MRDRRRRLMRLAVRALPVAVAAVVAAVAALLVPRLLPPRPLSEDIFADAGNGEHRVRAGLERARVVIPGRPHPFPFRPESRVYREAIGRRVTYHCSTNSRGYRGPEVTQRPAAGVTRVVCVGDSITFGHGVGDDEPYPAVLQRLLDDHGSFEVINVADVGSESADALATVTAEALELRPRVLTVCAGVNDVTNHYLDRHLDETWGHPDHTDAIVEPLRANLSAIVALARDHDIEPVLIVPPVTSFFPLPEGNAMCDAIRELAADRGVRLVDLQGRFAEQERRRGVALEIGEGEQVLRAYRRGRGRVLLQQTTATDRTAYIDDTVYQHLERSGVSQALSLDESHPNAQGHRLAAEMLLPVILDAAAASPAPVSASPR
jgi:lysophospholipase L1-like esterase